MGDIPDEIAGGGRGRPSGCLILGVIIGILVVAGIAALLLYGVYMRGKVKARLEEIRAAGQPVTFAEVLRTRDNVPDEENAALILSVALPALDAPADVPISDVYSLMESEEPGLRCSDVSLELAREHLARRAEILEIIHEAAQFETGVYPLDPAEMPFAVLMPHLSPLREAARLCACETLIAAQSGDGAGSALSVKDGLRARASLGEGWTIIEALVGIACDAITCHSLQEAMHVCQTPPEDLRMLREDLARQEQGTDMTSAFLGERAMGLFAFTASPRQLSALAGGGATGLSWPMALYSAVPGWRERDTLFYLDMMGGHVEACALPERDRMAGSRRVVGELEKTLSESPWRYPLSGMLMPALSRSLQESLKDRMRLRVARTALAVEEYRAANDRWPQTLDELVPQYLDAVPQDAFSDGPLRYVLNDQGALVYSLGMNGEDDHGVAIDEARARQEIDQRENWDIPFRLLNPELRGARQSTFRDDVMRSHLDLEALEALGFDRDRLRDLGLSEDEVDDIMYR